MSPRATAGTLGGVYGCVDGLRKAPHRRLRVVINSILNGASKRGALLGNSCGVAGESALWLRCGPWVGVHLAALLCSLPVSLLPLSHAVLHDSWRLVPVGSRQIH